MPEPRSTGTPSSLIAALAGGWVADAASLGLHWLYSSERINEIGGATPEFLPPRAEYYTKGFGYFAHDGKQPGDISHYGAATGVLIDSLLAEGGTLSVRDYQQRFRSVFGPGGQWQGFIDNPTRITLENLNRIEQAAVDQALSDMPAEITDKQKRILIQKVMPYTRRLSGDQLDKPVREAINLTYQSTQIQDAGVHLARTIDQQLTPESGADDTQLPAVSKLPPPGGPIQRRGKLARPGRDRGSGHQPQRCGGCLGPLRRPASGWRIPGATGIGGAGRSRRRGAGPGHAKTGPHGPDAGCGGRRRHLWTHLLPARSHAGDLPHSEPRPKLPGSGACQHSLRRRFLWPGLGDWSGDGCTAWRGR